MSDAPVLNGLRRNALASFFIARPIFAAVLALATMLAGLASLLTLPVSQYPDIAPITIRVGASYAGATADAVETSVTAKIESAMTGLDGLLYMESSSNNGSASVTLTFENRVNPDSAQSQVQNRVSRIQSQLPDSVQRQGVTVSRSAAGILMVGNIVSTDGRYSSPELADIMTSRINDIIQRVPGVGSIQTFGGRQAMRIWLDPMALQRYQLTPQDVTTAISARNAQVSAGALGASPTIQGQQLIASVVAQNRLSTPEEFRAIILKTSPEGAVVRLGDVARVELGLESYGRNSTFNGMPGAGFGVQLASGANAVSTAKAVHDALDGLAGALPVGVKIGYSYETTPFVEQSIRKVLETLVEAIVLVFLVLLIFLQSLRATFPPMAAIPVALLGTMGVLAALGYSVNMLTMFGMVLAIGLLVDDAIVVVENVERIMEEEGLGPREATEKSMGEITGALVGVALVLSAVFAPMAFFPGSVGVIYRQFSVAIVSAMALSALTAIILTPALCALLLRPKGHGVSRWFGWFNRGFAALARGYGALVGLTARLLIVFLALFGFMAWKTWSYYTALPSSFVPAEDQGVLQTQISLPPGANAARTQAVVDIVRDYYLTQEKDTVDSVFINVGGGGPGGGGGENQAQGFVKLKDYAARPSPAQSAQAVARRASAYFRNIRDAQVNVLAPPPIQGLGQVAGFSMYLVDSGAQGREALAAAGNRLADFAQTDPTVSDVRGNTRTPDSQLRVNIDQEKAGALGVNLTTIHNILNTAIAGTYVNDFVYNGDIKRVYVQGDAPYRMQPEDVARWWARNSAGEMVPFSAFTSVSWAQAPVGLARYNGVAALSMQGAAEAGYSSGEAMLAMEKLVLRLEGGFTTAWSGLSYQERMAGSQERLLYALSLLVVFLCLAALYESWSIPFAVILSVPAGLFGAVLAANWMGGSNDVYFKVGLLTTMGLTAKNAILIVEFARSLGEQGLGLLEATKKAARQRLRPVVMTSLAFMLGVTPLALATGAGSAAQRAIGVGVLGGMVSGTLLGLVFIPLLYIAVRRLSGEKLA